MTNIMYGVFKISWSSSIYGTCREKMNEIIFFDQFTKRDDNGRRNHLLCPIFKSADKEQAYNFAANERQMITNEKRAYPGYYPEWRSKIIVKKLDEDGYMSFTTKELKDVCHAIKEEHKDLLKYLKPEYKNYFENL